MFRTLKLVALALLIIVGGANLIPVLSLAATQDYHFELVDQTVHMGHDVPIAVRLLQVSTGKTVANATITGQKLQMLMGDMGMPGQVKAMTPDANGIYRFAGDVTMAGSWQLDLSATVPGENEPVAGTLKFQAVK
jgi:hypothetical protein